MSDPAIEAARRAFDAAWPEQGDFEFEFSIGGTVGGWAVAAAREVLAPLRAKHQRVQRPDGSYRCTSCRDAYGAHADWPTGTDRLIYSSEELS